MRRRAADRLPWWAATWRAASTSPPDAAAAPVLGAPSRRASWWATRSAILRVLTKTRVVRCSRTCPAIRSRTSENWAAAGHRLELAAGELDGHVEVPCVPAVDDGRRGRSVDAGQQAGHHLERTLGGGEADALQPAAPLGHQVGQPLQAEGEVGAALVPGQGVDLVDDDRVDAAEHGPRGRGGQQKVERLGGGDQDVGRLLAHGGALGGGVSPVRTATDSRGGARPSRPASTAIPSSGTRRFSSMSTASARSGET